MKSKIYKLIILASILTIPINTNAMMQSPNYIIYENVLQSFDGPIISNAACAAGENKITVTWNTNVNADSFVVYDTVADFANSHEQGLSIKNSNLHNVIVSGLIGGTTYYYKVKSTRVNGGVTTDSTVGTCTPTTPASAQQQAQQGGGGILIIDKTDKAAPIITGVEIKNITGESAEISWTTDEDSSSFAEYGASAQYGNTQGVWNSVKSHIVKLIGLTAETEYHFRALSSDSWGNLGNSGDLTFKTGAYMDEEKRKLAEEKKRLDDEIKKLRSENKNFMQKTLEELAALLPKPNYLGDPIIKIESGQALVSWTTDRDSNSFVAIAPDKDFRQGTPEPYLQVVGNDDVYTKNHTVRLYNLAPDTLYHLQLRSRSQFGPSSKSKDYTFRTKAEALRIISYYPQVVNDNAALFKWVTNIEADSAVVFTPYKGNVLELERSKTIKNNAFSAIHEISIEEFMPGVMYEVELISRDRQNNEARQVISKFSTAKDDLPPVITNIKTDSTIFLDREGKIQTIITWTTNESATSKVYYQEGVRSVEEKLENETDLNFDYTKDHIMIFTKFQPGKVYSFKVESIDAGGNASLSKVYTFMTPKQKESIFQIIVRILEQTFGWIKTIGK